MSYVAPLKDMLFCMTALADIDGVSRLPGFDDAGAETAEAVLEECARFAEGALAPLNASGDRQPPQWNDGAVTTSPGFKAAFRQFVDGGWQGLHQPVEFGGQGLPKTLGACCAEIVNGANLSFALCPLLTAGAASALLAAGTQEQKALFLPRFLSGEWTGTMNLTEPQAGSDLALLRARAEPQPDGSYRIFGTKIYITYGEHDLAANIVHLVLARLPDAPPGVKGISLFLVPKWRIDRDGRLGERNDVRCVSIEHKLGIKASPTAVLEFGDNGGAVGELLGQPHRGLETMFVMMNAARFDVGLQGIGVAERACQLALAYARQRVQGRPVGSVASASGPIIRHPDVQRMLMTMRSTTEACRAMAIVAAAEDDHAHHHPDAEQRRLRAERYELMVPLVKGYGTEMSVVVANLGIQVHGGMGYIEETGAAQLLRDARILPIYEGTTAIQANDLVGRKTLRDGGAAVRRLVDDVATTETALLRSETPGALSVGTRLRKARLALLDVVAFIVAEAESRPDAVYAGSVPYLMMMAGVVAGWQMGRALLVAQDRLQQGDVDAGFLQAKIASARFYAEHVLPGVCAQREVILDGGDSACALAEAQS